MTRRLSDPSVIRALLAEYGVHAKKSYGQNFLTSGDVLADVVEATAGEELDSCSAVVEIGPGVGTLTQALAEEGFARVVAVEKDRQLLPLLRKTLAGHANIRVVQGDALRIDWTHALTPEERSGRVRVAANLPYYITTPLIMSLLESSQAFERIVVMVQKEVADRMVATPGGKDYGALTLAVQYYSQVEVIRTVSADCFVPRPAVDSAVVLMRVRRPDYAQDDSEPFFRVVRAAFGQRRKTLANALAAGFPELGKGGVQQWLLRAGTDGGRRGETLSAEEFAELSKRL